MNNSEKINLLMLKVENLSIREQNFQKDIEELKKELETLQNGHSASIATDFKEKPLLESEPLINDIVKDRPIQKAENLNIPVQPQIQKPTSSYNFPKIDKSNLEKFIGENLISKIGILILVIGVAIGAKYAIEHEMISPLTRIILGYSMGVGLLLFAIKLKAKYESFSAVLLSGAVAILYFITYFAYSFYGLMPQFIAFALMVAFTLFTVFAAIKYNQQVIAHIGLVGAYGVPFLLSDGSGNVLVLLTYILIINIGILLLSLKKYWKSLYYASFGLTWIIFLTWRIGAENSSDLFRNSSLFAILYFVVFYITNLAYKIIKAENFNIVDVILIFLNSFIFYGIGYYILQDIKNGSQFLGLFTVINAVIHFVVSLIVYKRKLADKNLFYFVLALVITFITLAIPVQLSGGWVTIFWAVEACILLYLGVVKKITIYEKIAFPLVFLAALSLGQDLSENINYNITKAFFNVGFLTNSIFVAAFVFMVTINRKLFVDEKQTDLIIFIRKVLAFVLPSILILATYFTFLIEIDTYFLNLYENSLVKIPIPNTSEFEYYFNEDYILLKQVSLHIYTMFFVTVLTYLNLKKWKNNNFAIVNFAFNFLTILAFLTLGLYSLSELRENYILQNSKYFNSGIINIIVRYISIAFFAILIFVWHKLNKADFIKDKLKTTFDYLLYISVLWILSSELLHVLDLNGSKAGYKLGLSILWGSYSLLLIGIGIWKNKKHIRIGAIALFAITLIKLFFYDISKLDTIAKTIVFVALGILLLIISFLYNKYKHLIFDDAKPEN